MIDLELLFDTFFKWPITENQKIVWDSMANIISMILSHNLKVPRHVSTSNKKVPDIFLFSPIFQGPTPPIQ